MKPTKACIFNWSGGKDSALALYHCLRDPSLDIRYLVTTVSDHTNRVSMHGVREGLLIKQANSIGIPLYQIRLPDTPGIKAYNETMDLHMSIFREEGITHAIYGDIFLEDLKSYREARLKEVGMKGEFPLWGRDTTEVMSEFLNLGFRSIIVCSKEEINAFTGKLLDLSLLATFPVGMDICGENGEYHTFTFAGPIFKEVVPFKIGEKVYKEFEKPKDPNDNCFSKATNVAEKEGYWYLDLY